MTPGAWGQAGVWVIAYVATAAVTLRFLLWLLDRATPPDEPEAPHPTVAYPALQDDADQYGA